MADLSTEAREREVSELADQLRSGPTPEVIEKAAQELERFAAVMRSWIAFANRQ